MELSTSTARPDGDAPRAARLQLALEIGCATRDLDVPGVLVTESRPHPERR